MGTRTPTQFTGNVQGVAGSLVSMLDTNLVALGWSILAMSGNARIYQPGTGGTGYCLYLLDDGSVTGGAREAVARLCESSSTLSTLVNRSPTVAQQANNTCVWRKSSTLDTTNRPFILVGDSRFFVLRILFDTGISDMYFVSDLEGGIPSDSYNAVISQRGVANSGGGGLAFTNAVVTNYSGSSSNRFHIARTINGLVLSEYAGIVCSGSSFGGPLGTYPHPQTNKLHYSTVGVVSSGSASAAFSSGGAPRGMLPFVFEPHIFTTPSGIAVGDTWTDSAYGSSSLFLATTGTANSFTAGNGVVLQIGGTWDPAAMLQL